MEEIYFVYCYLLNEVLKSNQDVFAQPNIWSVRLFSNRTMYSNMKHKRPYSFKLVDQMIALLKRPAQNRMFWFTQILMEAGRLHFHMRPTIPQQYKIS